MLYGGIFSARHYLNILARYDIFMKYSEKDYDLTLEHRSPKFAIDPNYKFFDIGTLYGYFNMKSGGK